ncbi:MAG TPA: endonuclease/exonuclease/phosphatase family protein [Planctomycetaceae bacterium]|nr:endonuclease/exonuclease/phosphatase family protein [Planctomycetaceae bacterium]
MWSVLGKLAGHSRPRRESSGRGHLARGALIQDVELTPHGSPRSRSRERRHLRRQRIRTAVLWLSVGNLALMIVVTVLLRFCSERWWFSTALLYLPRSPYAAGSILLLPLAMVYNRKAAVLSGVALFLATGPIMGLKVPLPSWGFSALVTEHHLRIVTCNVHGYQPAFDGLISEMHSVVPDVVVFQEAFHDNPVLEKAFVGWHSMQVDEYFVAARYPITHVASFRSQAYQRVAAVAFEVADPQRRYRLINVHQTSPRKGLTDLRTDDAWDSNGRRTLIESTENREAEAAALRAFFEENRQGLPVVIAGDFNMPSDSSLYRAAWGDLENAFDSAGFGYGYTAPCGRNRFWPNATPWSRVDHILTTGEWQIQKCWIGSGNGSDHRLVAAILR